MDWGNNEFKGRFDAGHGDFDLVTVDIKSSQVQEHTGEALLLGLLLRKGSQRPDQRVPHQRRELVLFM